ncbi:MAG: MerR family DNA-binding protein [Candidatus Kerfeldbacteria bacterium]|nr:MerR family DNA-binding protein [Candidatus Kerfeldbacteria bacterium]
MDNPTLNIGTLATLAKVNRETIRFYQRNGLLGDTHRSAAGYRQFTQRDLQRVIFIRRAKDMGFSLAEIRELLAVADGEVVRCAEVRAVARRALTGVESRLTQLRRFHRVLTALVRQCRNTRRSNGCPIIDELSKGN